MPEAINLDIIHAAYLKGEGDVLNLCKKYGFAYPTVIRRSRVEGWRDERAKIGQGKIDLVQSINQQVVKSAVSSASLAIREHLDAVLADGKLMQQALGDKLKSMALPEVKSYADAAQLVSTYAKADDLIRRAHGLADTPQQVDITSGGNHIQALGVIESCRKLVQDGKASSKDIDIQALLLEAKSLENDGNSSLPDS